MTVSNGRTIVVAGATGLQGGAVARHLLQAGWRARALTRNPMSQAARALAELGAHVIQADMDDPASLRPAFEDAYGVYSVQNPMISGPEGEVRQGKKIADVARQAGVQHLVYASAGIGKATGVPSWDSKLQVEAHMKALGLPLTIVRPLAFMELMTEKKFFPAVSTWRVMPTLMGASSPVAWICADDLGAIVAQVFAHPDQFIGQDLKLATDIRSLDECRAIYTQVMGKPPRRFPMPVWMFARLGFVGKDLTTMWRWLQTHPIDFDIETARAIYPEARSVAIWLSQHKAKRE